MKQIFLLFILFTFTCNQAFAYGYVSETQEDEAIVNLMGLEKIKSSIFSKKKTLKKLKKELKRAKKLTEVEQKELVKSRFEKGYVRAKKIIKKILKNERLISKISYKSNLTKMDVKNSLNNIIVVKSKYELWNSFISEIAIQGGYEQYLKNRIEELTINKIGQINKTKRDRKPASINVDPGNVIMIFLLISTLVAPIFLAIGLILLALGVSALPFVIATGALTAIGWSAVWFLHHVD
ncbi:MAG: hypothetical protein N4A33_02735 [Bacteriovoracaceae bacterium]|jgi:hypothetical protein|nr:hypothetical protein [Bacteriovoracaceae bacterium]